MKSAVSGNQLAARKLATLACSLLTAYGSLSCSIPNLETADCGNARDVVREFYSIHFGNDMTFSPDNLEKRKAYLSPQFFEALNSAPQTVDPFTRTSDLPKAFRVGACRVIEPDRRVTFNVLLFWKTDTRTEQKPISVEMENAAGRWLVERVDDVPGTD